MKNAQFGLAVVVLFAVMGCGKFRSLTGSDDFDKLADGFPEIKAEMGPIAPGATAIRHLTSIDPKVAPLAARFEAAETAAMTDLLKKLGQNTKAASNPANENPWNGVLSLMQASGPATAPDPARSAETVYVTTGMVGLMGKAITSEMPAGKIVDQSSSSTREGVTTNVKLEMGRDNDGSPVIGMGTITEIDFNGVKVRSEASAKIVGQRCPDQSGQVSFKVTAKFGAFSGENGFMQELTANVKATVSDEAKLLTSTMDVTQGTREVKGGQGAYVESKVTISDNGSGSVASNKEQTRRSQAANDETAARLDKAGLDAAFAAGKGALRAAELVWYDGGCVEINAPSPGNVKVNSVTHIRVKVIHKFDASDVPSKVEAILNGETSIEPKMIPETPRELAYTAPAESGKSATIDLTATSRRGRATLQLNATTGGNAYAISGNIDEASMSGTTCDSSQPFSIGGTLQFKFTPTSATTGTYTYRGPYSATGSGPYVINGDGSMKLDGTGCIMGGHCKTYSHSWTATPIDPSSCK